MAHSTEGSPLTNHGQSTTGGPTLLVGATVTHQDTGAEGRVTDGPWQYLNRYDTAGPWVEVTYDDTRERIMTPVSALDFDRSE